MSQYNSMQSENIQKKILLVRQEAKTLYNEVELIRHRIQDTNLSKYSERIKSLPKNFSNLKLYNTLRGHQNKIAKIKWSYDSSKVLSASQDGYMIIWDAVTGFKKHAITLENQWVLTCSYSPNGKLVASAGLDNACTIYKIKFDTYDANNYSSGYEMLGNFYQSIQSVFKGHTAYISDCEFVNDSSIITASGDSTCSMWDIIKGNKVRDFIDHLGDVLCLSKFPNNELEGPLFLSGSSDGYAKIWDMRSRSPVQNFFISHSDVNCIKNFPDGNAFITGSDDGLIRLFDLRSDCEISNYWLQSHFKNLDPLINQQQNFHNNTSSPSDQFSLKTLSVYSTIDNPGVLSVDFSKSGRLIYSCYSEYGCLIWDTLKSEIVGSIGNDHMNKINQVSVSPDGLGIGTASWDSTIKIWSV